MMIDSIVELQWKELCNEIALDTMCFIRRVCMPRTNVHNNNKIVLVDADADG